MNLPRWLCGILLALVAMTLAVAGIAKSGIDGRLALHSALYDVWPWLGGRGSWCLAGLVPWIELLIAVTLVLPWTWWIGVVGVWLLSLGFLAWITAAIYQGYSGDCGCFGPSHPPERYWMLARVMLMAALPAVAWLGLRSAPAKAR